MQIKHYFAKRFVLLPIKAIAPSIFWEINPILLKVHLLVLDVPVRADPNHLLAEITTSKHFV